MLPNGLEPELGLEEKLGFQWEERKGAAMAGLGVRTKPGPRRDCVWGTSKSCGCMDLAEASVALRRPLCPLNRAFPDKSDRPQSEDPH